jgi:hypothetical protein
MRVAPEARTSASTSVAAAEPPQPIRRIAIQVDEPAPERPIKSVTVLVLGDPTDPKTPLAIVSSHREEAVP